MGCNLEVYAKDKVNAKLPYARTGAKTSSKSCRDMIEQLAGAPYLETGFRPAL
jgi:hypothetical protein